MIISNLYQTKIEITQGTSGTSYYNVGINATDVTVTVTLVDFNNVAVTGKSVTLTVDKGYFTKCVGTSTKTITGNTTKSVTGTTDSNGKITATYTASEWGLCTFSANNNNIKIYAGGWKEITSISYNNTSKVSSIILYVNEEIRMVELYISFNAQQYTKGTVYDMCTINTIANNYSPKYPVRVSGYYGDSVSTLTSAGLVQVKQETAKSNSAVGFNFIYNY